ncbi:HNH endonuclease signature motif containing protein [Deinococcus sp. VB142]|uniref:HNH endonuclease signature motif containing protein n=1 Tax=Deinococcus sp. VB142 TaxID=3112952 RepID=A0AAU6Q7Z8_9DEIO
MYKLYHWDKETKKQRLVLESDVYDLIWDKWVADKENHIIGCDSEIEGESGSHDFYLVVEGRRPAAYKSCSLAKEQTTGVREDSKGYSKREVVDAWFAALPSINRRESRDVEIVRKSCGCCWYCGKTLVGEYGKYLGKGQRDHQTSRVNGGGDEIGNMVLACEKCNTAEKNHLNLEDYRAKVLAANPQAYPEGHVVFFGEKPVQERHRLKRGEDPQWVCPGESNPDIPCTQLRS